MRKFIILTIMIFGLISCEKGSDTNNYSSVIIGWWELVETNPDDSDLSDGLRLVWEFAEDGKQAPFQNDDYDENGELIFSETLNQVQPYYDYWIEGDILCDKNSKNGDCGEFGNPNCGPNEHGYQHYTKILKLDDQTLVLEICSNVTKNTWKFKKIAKPSNLMYK